MLKVALIGRSSHCLTYLATILSRFWTTHVLLRSATVRCHDSLDRTIILHLQLIFLKNIEGGGENETRGYDKLIFF